MCMYAENPILYNTYDRVIERILIYFFKIDGRVGLYTNQI